MVVMNEGDGEKVQRAAHERLLGWRSTYTSPRLQMDASRDQAVVSKIVSS